MVTTSALTAETALADADLIGFSKYNAGTWLPRQITVANAMVKAYGSIYVIDGSGSQALLADTWTKVTQFVTNGLSKNTTPDHTNDRVRITNAGKYRVWFSCSFTTPSATKTMDLAVYWNGSPTPARAYVATADDGRAICAFAQDIIDVTSGTTDAELWVRSNGATATFDVKQAQLGAERSI